MKMDSHRPGSSEGMLYQGHVEHTRFTPCGHGFRTPVHFYAFDLSKLASLDKRVTGFGHNRFAPVSVRDRDYLTPEDLPLTEKLKPWLVEAGINAAPARIWLVTSARWWGNVFNPVSFYLIEDESCTPIALISEVNNTFGDRHIYAEPLERKHGILQADHAKEFHVSPFNNMDGSYRFTVRREEQSLYIGVDLYRENEKVLEAWIEGVGEPLTTRSLRRIALLHPLRPWLTMPRIVWQAILLKFKRRLQVHKRPEPSHSHTIRSRHQPVKSW